MNTAKRWKQHETDKRYEAKKKRGSTLSSCKYVTFVEAIIWWQKWSDVTKYIDFLTVLWYIFDVFVLFTFTPPHIISKYLCFSTPHYFFFYNALHCFVIFFKEKNDERGIGPPNQSERATVAKHTCRSSTHWRRKNEKWIKKRPPPRHQ